ncbi:MAG: hypothetical protein U9Q15_00035, partial [Patescibacteria group bacterium]|nr:hypothetical protein [Patescibacteria group bacterium]
QSRALNTIDVVYYKEEFDGDLDEIEEDDITELQADGFVMQHLIHVLPFMPIEGKTMKTHVVLSKSASALYLESVVEIPALTKTQRKVLATDMSTIEVDILPDTQEEEFDEKEDTNSSQATQTKLFK